MVCSVRLGKTCRYKARLPRHDAEFGSCRISIGHDTVEKPPIHNGPQRAHGGSTLATGRQMWRRSFSPCPSGRRCRPESGAASRPAGRQAEDGRRAGAVAPGDLGADHRPGPTEDRCPLMPQRILHNVRQVMPEGGIVALDNGIQDLVCAQLPHACGEYAAAGQRAGDDGGGAAVGDDGVNAVSRAPHAGSLWRRRAHDEQPRDGDGGASRSQPGGVDSARTMPMA